MNVELRERVLDRLRTVIDPETGADVVRMRLIEELHADGETGRVRLKFRPSSPLCPLAVHLALAIRDAVIGLPHPPTRVHASAARNLGRRVIAACIT